MAGYSQTPLAKKLGIKPGMTVATVDAPAAYRTWLEQLPDDVVLTDRIEQPLRAVHVFVTGKAALKKHLASLRKRLEPDGFVWVSWPKKAAKVETDVTEDIIRELALPLGFVDIKVCAVSDIWSGLKLVIRKDQRPA